MGPFCWPSYSSYKAMLPTFRRAAGDELQTLLLWLEVINQSQIEQKQPGRQQQLEKRGVWEGQQRLTTFQQDTCLRQPVPYYSLGDHSPVPALRRHRASPSRPSGDRN